MIERFTPVKLGGRSSLNSLLNFDRIGWVAEPFSKWGNTSARQKNYIKCLWLELATVASQALKYDVITNTHI